MNNKLSAKKEMVNHPAHYNRNGRKECIKEMEELFGIELTSIWAIMTAYKYQYRKGEKDEVLQEEGKIHWYEEYAISKAPSERALLCICNYKNACGLS